MGRVRQRLTQGQLLVRQSATSRVALISLVVQESSARNIDPVFAKTNQNARFLLSENERFRLVFVKTRSINSGTVFVNRNLNFLPCGTGTVTCQKVGTGTVIKWHHKRSHKHTVSNCVFDFLHLTFFSFTFYNTFEET
jgi:hypothetical protein